ncbi:DNA mismatch repair endonuclease MutL [halophilic archaeon]|nr:DNA mismatch repair endonuclease MutL [halophilic archaeon]
MSEGDDANARDTTIRELDERTVQQIAAGEVVERPASAVKELVENSLDADASRVDVTVEAGGTERIAVRDDGVGMTEADARAAVREHTTSKIRDIDDLESGVGTLGFRGEALYTIGAVSRTTIRTKPRGGDRGTELRLVGGEVEAVGPAGCPEGTTVEVADLFFNTPAREKYLKTEATEFSHVNRVVTRYALANPDVAVSLTHDGREVFSTTGRGDLRSAILSVYGREVAEAMFRVESSSGEVSARSNDGDESAAPGDGDESAASGDGESSVDVSGYVSHPETTRSSREYVSTYVNGRYVRSSTVREAVLDAYGDQLAPDRYPFAVLFLDLPGDAVDVNAHPRKMEVRFGDEAAVRETVRETVESALLDHGLVRSSAPRGRSTPAEADVDPVRGDVDRDGPPREQSELGASDGPADVGASEADDDGGPNRSDAATRQSSASTTEPSEATRTTGESSRPSADGRESRSEQDSGRAPVSTDDAGAATEVDGSSRGAESGGSSPAGSRTSANRRSGRRGGDEASASRDDARTGDDGGATAGGSKVPKSAERKFRPATEAGTLGDAPEREFDRLPAMSVLGQLNDTYVVAETRDGLVLVDQHAADERVNYERLCEQFAGETTTQVLAEPVELELTAREAALFDEYRDALAQLGFHAGRVPEDPEGEEPDDEGDASAVSRSVEVTTVPAVLDETLDPELLRDVLSEFVSTDGDETDDAATTTADALISDLACYPSITGNTSLKEGDVVSLLAELDDCENPYACPHGRPVVVEFSKREIEERFERDYPGHGRRRPE